MRVDFYRLSRDSALDAVALLARKSVEAGRRVLVVSAGEEAQQALSRSLWESAPEAFLANGIAGSAHDARQPVLISGDVDAANGAQFLILADGQWRDPGSGFERVMLVFDDASIEGARACWRQLGEDEAIRRHFWKQDESGRWVEGP
ncbi:hypothetical protein GCM10009127_25410 [Alteraurantiacibacter aestuarii]|uniref:DNA polymerase III subunit chi n=1 Tax=Alteraurantiacibacter aestuarii TaxID=650004 RepID=UPI0031D20C9B